jgi:hypothetical protein
MLKNSFWFNFINMIFHDFWSLGVDHEKPSYNRNDPIYFYRYDDYYEFSHFFYFIDSNKPIFNEYLKQYNLNVDDLFVYFYINYYLTKCGLIAQGGIHTIFFNHFVKTKLTPTIRSDFNKLYENHFNVQPVKSKISNNLIPIYHFIKNKFKKNINIVLSNRNIKFNSTTIVKNINDRTQYTLYFLRKNKSFNKGRYSRNRQNYRTGVYWCLYINIIALFGLYFYFYRFTFNFGYFWWLFYCLPASFIIPQAIKFRLYNPYIFYKSIISYFEFLYNCINIIFFFKK